MEFQFELTYKNRILDVTLQYNATLVEQQQWEKNITELKKKLLLLFNNSKSMKSYLRLCDSITIILHNKVEL